MIAMPNRTHALNGTPLLSAASNLFVKMEAFNAGGSHKARPARRIVADAVREGHLAPSGRRRILEKTGGNFGIGLAVAAGRLGIGVDLVVGLSFSPLKRALCEAYGARLVGIDRLRAGATPKDVIAEFLHEKPDDWHYTDQFANPGNLRAHEEETGPELVTQLVEAGVGRGRSVVLVKGAGTGASLTGIARALRGTFDDVTVVAIQPAGCDILRGVFVDHRLEGIAVGAMPPFLDRDSVDRVVSVSADDARSGQLAMAGDIGFFPGASSGAGYHIARGLSASEPDAVVVTIAYDTGDYTLLRDIEAAAPQPTEAR